MLRYVAVVFSVVQIVAAVHQVLQVQQKIACPMHAMGYSLEVLCAALCCSVVQCVSLWCSVVQRRARQYICSGK